MENMEMKNRAEDIHHLKEELQNEFPDMRIEIDISHS